MNTTMTNVKLINEKNTFDFPVLKHNIVIELNLHYVDNFIVFSNRIQHFSLQDH